VGERLAAAGRQLRAVGSPYAVNPGTVRKADHTPYAVFTPFGKAWTAVGWPAPLPAPVVSWRGRGSLGSDPLPPEIETGMRLSEGSEDAAHRRWSEFQRSDLDRYDEDRNRPDRDGTSRLSAHLRFGTVHPRQLLSDLHDSRAHEVYASELCWREFYADVLYHQPHTAWENLQPKMDAMPVDTDAAARRRFRAWCEGRTGFPLVDAGMRQLAATGWMHNRVRMVVASFLVKDLHLPWQWGARFFMAHLVDGDLASNNHGWQWAAGSGTDAAPYFRVFNPFGQGERFDPDGVYVRRWIPALAAVPDRFVHRPFAAPAGVPDGYVAPIVDHAEEREEALRRHRSIGTR
jgi:deoxyribodipyrimidine photo-lyase